MDLLGYHLPINFKCSIAKNNFGEIHISQGPDCPIILSYKKLMLLLKFSLSRRRSRELKRKEKACLLFHSSGRLREQLLTSALNCKAKVPTSFHNADRNKSRCRLREWCRKESIDYIIITFFNFDITFF